MFQAPEGLSSKTERKGLVREATKMPQNLLKNFEASVVEMGETVHTEIIDWVLHQSKKKSLY